MKRKTAYLGMFLALALICSYIESLIPFHFGVPGIKLGLANVIVVVMLYGMGAREALLLSILRILLAGFLFGNPFSIIYSLSGGILSYFVMLLLKNTQKFHVISVSTAGGIFHNLGQLLVASAVVENYNLFYYAPVLLVSGFITGFLIGNVAQELIFRLKGRF
ncbi:MAG: Gx transporter family protein [Eubacterium sp.]|jgi:heptaprenyl diphosphate synthase|nr:Gx transporter family protein [Eubacterium sp.]